MTRRDYCNELNPIGQIDATSGGGLEQVLELLTDHGFDGMAQAMQTLFNEAMKLERSVALGAHLYERSDERLGYANGYKPKTVQTRVGELALAVPQTRGMPFYPSSLERGQRSERALKLAIAEMYLQGVSTRKVAAVMEELCGLDVTSMQVSRAVQALDEELTQWRNRILDETPYVLLDARYEKVRVGGSVVSCALLIAIGIMPDGQRTILGVSVSLSEAEVHWRDMLAGPSVSRATRRAHDCQRRSCRFASGPRCAVFRRTVATVPVPPGEEHARLHVPKGLSQEEASEELRGVFNAPDRVEAERQLARMVDKYADTPRRSWPPGSRRTSPRA